MAALLALQALGILRDVEGVSVLEFDVVDGLESVKRGEKIPLTCPYHCIRTCDHRNSPYCIALALMQAKKGNLKRGFVFSGQNAYRVDRIISVKELIESLVQEFVEGQKTDTENHRLAG